MLEIKAQIMPAFDQRLVRMKDHDAATGKDEQGRAARTGEIVEYRENIAGVPLDDKGEVAGQRVLDGDHGALGEQ